MSVIQIKRSTTSTVPTSNSGGATSTIDAGELTYSYAAGDGSGDESGVGKLFIGHPDGKSGSNAAVIIGGSLYTNMLDHTAGTATASSAVILNSASHVDAVKTAALSIGASGSETLVTSTAAELNYLDTTTVGTAQASKAVILDANAATSAVKTAALHIGTSGSETLVSATGAELNKLDGVTATTAQLNTVNVTAGTATASKAVVLNAASHIDTVKTTALHIGASGSATQVTATAAELNILDDATLDTAELNKLDGCTATTAQLNFNVVTAGTATASKAVVLDSNSHINTVKTAALHIGASGSETAVTSTATELNLLDGITAIDSDLSSVAGGHTTLTSALAVKTYVDNTRSGLEVKDSCVVATTADDTGLTYANGTAGVGATLTNDGNEVYSIDGVALTLNMRVLVKDQNPATENGIYYVSTAGAVGATLVLTRATDADTAAELSSGVFFFVEQGSANADSGWVMTQDTAITFGSTTVDFAQFSGAGQITAGDGLTKTSNTLAVNVGTGISLVSDEVRINTSWAGQAAITTLGTIGTGVWRGTAIEAQYGGTGLNTSSSTGVAIVTSGTWSTPTSLTVPFGGTGAASFTSNGIVYGNGAGTLAVTAAGTDKYFLYSNSGTPAWTNVIDGGTF